MVRKPWRIASEAFGRARDHLEPTVAGRIWQRLRELGFISNSLQFAAVFTLGFIPFLNVVLAILGSGLSRAILIRSGLSTQASHDVTTLFAHGRTAPPACRFSASSWRSSAELPFPRCFRPGTWLSSGYRSTAGRPSHAG